jgi:hypothetical protein
MTTYFYNQQANLSCSELFFWIAVDKTLEQLGVKDIGAVFAILAGQPVIPIRAKVAGATKGTSVASVVCRQILNYDLKMRLPMLTGTCIKTLHIGPDKKSRGVCRSQCSGCRLVDRRQRCRTHHVEFGHDLQCHGGARRSDCAVNVELEHVVAFIRREVPPPRRAELSEDTDLRRDLRMAEEDAEELLAKFFQEFSVALGDFDSSRYFPSEGLWLLRLNSSKPPPVRLTLGMLLQAARDKVWHTATLEN